MVSTRSRSTLHQAHQALRDSVVQVDHTSSTLPTPCTQWVVAQVIEHAALDQGIWASAVADAPPPKGEAFAPIGDLPADVDAMVDAALVRAAQAWAGIDTGTDHVPSPLPQGELDIETARNAAALDAAVHAWDIAVAIGVEPALDDELSVELLPTARALVEPLREWGAYAAALAPADDDSPTEALLCYLGRDPHWAPLR